MDYQLTRKEEYSLGSITTENIGVTIAHLSVDTHHINTVTEQALQHMYPEALISGAGQYDRSAFLHAVNMLGASISTSITDSKLTITLKSTSDVFLKLLHLTEIMLSQPAFAEKELERIRLNVTNDLQVRQEKSSYIAHETLRNALYGKTDRRYASDSKIIAHGLSSIGTTELKQYHEQIQSMPWTCTIAGTQKNITDFHKLITKLKKVDTTTITSPAHEQLPINRKLILKSIPSRANIDFSIGTPIPITLRSPDYLPLMFALGVLALPGFAGRLMNTVRNKEGLTYTIYGYRESFSSTEQGYIRIITFFSPEKTILGLTSTFRELKKFHQSGITDDEFKTFQTIFTTKQTMLQDSLLQRISDLHSFNENGFSIQEMAKFNADLKTVTRAQVNAVIKKYFDPKNFSVSGAGPITKVNDDVKTFFGNIT